MYSPLPILQGVTKVYVLSVLCWIFLVFWTPSRGLPAPQHSSNIDAQLLFNDNVMKLTRELDSTLRESQTKIETVQLQHKVIREQGIEIQKLINQSYDKQYLEMGISNWYTWPSGVSPFILSDKGQLIFSSTTYQ